MTRLRLVQVYYDEAQRASLDPDAVHHFNPQLSELHENQVILDRLGAGDHLQSDYWGVTSWRMQAKTGLSVATLGSLLGSCQSLHDAYCYDGIARGSELADNRDTAIGALIRRLQRAHGLIVDEVWVPVLCNYWIASRTTCGAYLHFLHGLHQTLQQDERCRLLLQTHRLQHRERDHSLHPFVYEYFFGLFLRNHPGLRVGHIYRMVDSSGGERVTVLERTGMRR